MKKVSKRNKYLIDLYWNGCDKRDPINLGSWFTHLLTDGYVRIIHSHCVVEVTEKGLAYIESIGLVQPEAV
jgi:hypothetical protein